ncbi:MAG: hypothetical protein KC422_13070 [Trueperaceae bacterium]|nr:hypothetical protein [Trueperaceae bacterium]
MRRGLLIGFIIGFLCLALAQSSDPVLQNYSLAFENLNKATTLFSTDTQQSIEALNDASQMLRPLSTGSNSNVIPGLERTFERAKTAIQNQSLSDLEVQVSVLKGGFWRLVYESALSTGETGDVAAARIRLAQIASDMGLAPEISSNISNTTQILSMIANLETGIAQQMQTRLDSIRGTLANSELSAVKANVYRDLAAAYSYYLPVQDSPRSSAELNDAFNRSFSDLVNGDAEAFASDLESLTSNVSGLSAAAQGIVTAAPVEPVVEANTETNTEAAPVETTTPTETVPVETSLSSSTSEQPVATPAETAETSTPTPTAPNVSISTANADLAVDAEALRKELVKLGLTVAQQDRLIELYSKEGYSSLKSVIDKLYADSAKVIVATSQGNPDHAKSLIGSMQATYGTYLKAILDQTNPNFARSLEGLFNHLQSLPGLRQQDVVVLAEHIDSLASVISNNSVASLNKTELALTGIWSGWLRLIIIFLLGLASFVPLYLLYLAFGGGNRNWQLIGWSLFCLLLPLMYEGLSYLSSLISSLAGGIPILDLLGRYSIFQSTLSQIIWVIVSGAAITLASLGLYGICVQFGLLGQRKQTQNHTVVETSSETAANATSFDWDEEF